MKCLNHGSWLRSLWKALPFGPQFACALGAPTHAHAHTRKCSRPLLLAESTNQPRRSQARRRRRRARGRRRGGACNFGLWSTRSSGKHVSRTSVFIHPARSGGGTETIFWAIKRSQLFMGKQCEARQWASRWREIGDFFFFLTLHKCRVSEDEASLALFFEF